ncbi:VanZ family protein [Mucilaginibacter antarcticus]|uniref:VanZ family protein n=1 Tax=Mucilaginibacter antarcticus TaxID=1855725 RepID=A0ABW5XKA9_9SPHI
MKAQLKYHRLTILWALFIFIICNLDLGGVGKSHLFFEGFDKLTHCGLFFVLVVFYCNGYLHNARRDTLTPGTAFLVTVVVVVYGAVIELLQLYVFTWRGAEWADLFCDTVGACMATFCILVITTAVKNVKA